MRLFVHGIGPWRPLRVSNQTCYNEHELFEISKRVWHSHKFAVEFCGQIIPFVTEQELLLICKLVSVFHNENVRAHINDPHYESYDTYVAREEVEQVEPNSESNDSDSDNRDNSEDPFSDPEKEFYRGLINEDLDFEPRFGKARVDDDEIF